ncbi:MAG: hypothetical protein ABR532_03835, partial [Candidatus Dormibacteria bacterium]
AGVYRRVGAPETWEQGLMAGCLAVDAIASHRAAAVLWRLPDVEPVLELTIPQRRHTELKGFEIYRTSFLQPVDRTHRHGIPVTSLARTVVDVSLKVPSLGPALIDHVLARRKVPLALLLDRLEAQGVRGRSGAGDLMQLLEGRQGRSRHVDSGLQRQLEKIALDGYAAGLLPEPNFEYPVQLSDGRWKYPDVAYPIEAGASGVSVGFEGHSYEHHSTLPAFAADCERNLDLFGEGWMIVPITAVQVRDPVCLVDRMARIIAAAQGRRC